eukprot:2119661-Rhodomonas_salina.1
MDLAVLCCRPPTPGFSAGKEVRNWQILDCTVLPCLPDSASAIAMSGQDSLLRLLSSNASVPKLLT